MANVYTAMANDVAEMDGEMEDDVSWKMKGGGGEGQEEQDNKPTEELLQKVYGLPAPQKKSAMVQLL